jgi:hypothetical protein
MLLALVTGHLLLHDDGGRPLDVRGLLVMIIGIPFFLLFVGFTRVLALAEAGSSKGCSASACRAGRCIPPRAPRSSSASRRCWLTVAPGRRCSTFLLMLPLGILYFVIATVGICVSLGLIGGSVATVLLATGVGYGGISLDDNAIINVPTPLAAPFLLVGGVVLLTLVMHLIRGIGRGHGTLAKHLLVARADAAG